MRLRRWTLVLMITLMLIDAWLPEAPAMTSRPDDGAPARPPASSARRS